MRYLVPAGVFLLMVSVGMSLKLSELLSTLRRLTWLAWARMVLATFILPPLLALLLSNLFRLTLPETGGIFLVGAAPGAPLLTRNLSRKGFDMHVAATYQLWAALMVPVMIPIVVAAAARVYSRSVWISPAALLNQIVTKQLLPLALGMAIVWFAPKVGEKYQVTLNVLGNALLTILIVLVLVKLGPALKAITPMLPVVALLLAVGSVGMVWLMRISDPQVKRTFAICNANRHVGLALLLSGQYFRSTKGLPAIACYALIAPVVIIAYALWHRSTERSGQVAVSGAR